MVVSASDYAFGAVWLAFLVSSFYAGRIYERSRDR